MTPDLKLYQWAMRLAAPLLPFYLRRRVKAGKEDPARLSERFGKTNIARPTGGVIWLHAASVGESLMLMPLIAHLRQQRADVSLLFTTGTLTSAALMAKRLPPGCFHQFAPADTPKAVAAFLDHWQPNYAIWAESEIWPNLILATRSRNIPTALINARMSAKSLEGWAKRKETAKLLIGGFDPLLAADSRTAQALSDLLDTDIPVSGNLKYAAPALPAKRGALMAVKRMTKDRPTWLAASTHHGEEGLIALAHKTVQTAMASAKPDAAKTLLILAPRHPERAELIERILRDNGLSCVRRSLGETPEADTDVYLFDTLGELGIAYRAAPVSCVCGSLAPGLFGHNPLEPARLDSAIISGVNVESFADIYDELTQVGGAQLIADTVSFPDAIVRLLTNETLRKAQIKAAKKVAGSQDKVLNDVWNALRPQLPQNPPIGDSL